MREVAVELLWRVPGRNRVFLELAGEALALRLVHEIGPLLDERCLLAVRVRGELGIVLLGHPRLNMLMLHLRLLQRVLPGAQDRVAGRILLRERHQVGRRPHIREICAKLLLHSVHESAELLLIDMPLGLLHARTTLGRFAMRCRLAQRLIYGALPLAFARSDTGLQRRRQASEKLALLRLPGCRRIDLAGLAFLCFRLVRRRAHLCIPQGRVVTSFALVIGGQKPERRFKTKRLRARRGRFVSIHSVIHSAGEAARGAWQRHIIGCRPRRGFDRGATR